MDKATLEAELKALAERARSTDPAVTGILYTVLGALAMGEERSLLQHLRPWVVQAQQRAIDGRDAALRAIRSARN